MDITDKDILQSLKTKKERLTLELHKVDVALAVYEDADNVELNHVVAPPRTVNKKSTGITTSDDDKDLNVVIPLEYSPSLTYSGKILFVLNVNVRQIVEELLKLEPTFNKETLAKRITNMTSRLFRAKKLKAKGFGRKNKYSLI
jgi:hypothetical protein